MVNYAVQIVLNTRSSGPVYLSTNLMNAVKSSGLQPGFRMLAPDAVRWCLLLFYKQFAN